MTMDGKGPGKKEADIRASRGRMSGRSTSGNRRTGGRSPSREVERERRGGIPRANRSSWGNRGRLKRQCRHSLEKSLFPPAKAAMTPAAHREYPRERNAAIGPDDST